MGYKLNYCKFPINNIRMPYMVSIPAKVNNTVSLFFYANVILHKITLIVSCKTCMCRNHEDNFILPRNNLQYKMQILK